MIEVKISSALLIYMGILLFFFLGIWLQGHWKEKRKKRLEAASSLAICEYCHFAYLADTLKVVNKCPSCGFLNKKNWYQR